MKLGTATKKRQPPLNAHRNQPMLTVGFEKFQVLKAALRASIVVTLEATTFHFDNPLSLLSH